MQWCLYVGLGGGGGATDRCSGACRAGGVGEQLMQWCM